MKKSFSILTACLLGLIISNQSFAGDRVYKAFKVDVSAGYVFSSYVFPSGPKQKAALVISIEPKYGITDNIWLGLRLEGAVVAYQIDPFVGLGISSQLLTGDYSYMVNKDFRPFAGLGVGNYSYFAIYKNSDIDESNKTISKIGFCPRIGFEYQHFRMSFEYNAVSEVASYSAIKIGAVIGGGKK